MCDLNDFLETNPRSRKSRPYDNKEIALLVESKAPSDIFGFLKEEGYMTYHDDFFSTTMPQDHFQTFSEWGLNGKECFAFLKTAFGSLCYCYKDKIFQLDPVSGNVYKGRFRFCKFMNLLATMDSFLEACYFDIYQKIEKKQVLRSDEIYAFVPALPLGGSLEGSKLEVVKIREHLSILAQLFEGKARKI